jgi:hypothetical protein
MIRGAARGHAGPSATPSTRRDVVGRGWRDWAEEYWDVLAIAVAFACALTVGTVLAVAFNLITISTDAPRVEPRDAAPAPLSDARPPLDDRQPALKPG